MAEEERVLITEFNCIIDLGNACVCLKLLAHHQKWHSNDVALAGQ